MEAWDCDREQCRLMAKVAQQAERYEDMVICMRRLIHLADAERMAPSEEERTLLSAAYKGAVNARRTARRVVVDAMEVAEKEDKEKSTDMAGVPHEKLLQEGDGDVDTSMLSDMDGLRISVRHETQGDSDDPHTEMCKDNAKEYTSRIGSMELQSHGGTHNDHDGPARTQAKMPNDLWKLLAAYCEVIEGEICRMCHDVIQLLDEHLHAEELESKAFFLKLKADYLRYIAEVQTGQRRDEISKETLSLYEAAQDIVKKHLPATHHIRLGLALNFSVFYVDIMNSQENALSLAKEAVQDAMEEIGNIDLTLSKDCVMILDLIQGNIKLWSTSIDDRDKSKENNAPTMMTHINKDH